VPRAWVQREHELVPGRQHDRRGPRRKRADPAAGDTLAGAVDDRFGTARDPQAAVELRPGAALVAREHGVDSRTPALVRDLQPVVCAQR
jgi:hypothetical protein